MCGGSASLCSQTSTSSACRSASMSSSTQSAFTARVLCLFALPLHLLSLVSFCQS